MRLPCERRVPLKSHKLLVMCIVSRWSLLVNDSTSGPQMITQGVFEGIYPVGQTVNALIASGWRELVPLFSCVLVELYLLSPGVGDDCGIVLPVTGQEILDAMQLEQGLSRLHRI